MKQYLFSRQLVISAVVLLGLLFVSSPVLALFPYTPGSPCSLPDGSQGTYQDDGRTCCPSGTTLSGNSCLFTKYINPLINLLAAAVGVVAVISIIVGGIEYSASAGDPQRAARGRQHIINALIGLLAFFLLYGFLQFILPGGLLSGGLLNG